MFTLNQPQDPHAYLAERISNNFDVLVKSKNCVDKLGTRITEMQKSFSLNKNNVALKCVSETAKGIKNTIQHKIESNFAALLNEQKRVNLIEVIGGEDRTKDEATKKLIQDYWVKKQENESEARRKTLISCKENLFPKIKPYEGNEENTPGSPGKNKKKAIISSLNVKIYEKQKERESMKKHKQEKILAYLYSYMVHVIDYKVQNDTPEFLLFQKLNYTKWDPIENVLKSVENFCKHFELKYCTLDLQKVLQLIDSKSKTEKSNKAFGSSTGTITFTKMAQFQQQSPEKIRKLYSPHQLLGCLENCEDISAQNHKKAGIRFYGNKGKMRAIVKIQSVWRGKFVFLKVKKLFQKVKNVLKIQRAYRLYLNYCKTKSQVQQRCLEKYRWFTQNQQKFRSTYRINELTKKVKYEIHICSDSQNQWQRVSTQKFSQRQNAYFTRIFKIFKEDQTKQTRIIFITAAPLPTQILNYFFKLLELGGAMDYKNRIIFMSPERCQGLLQKIPITRVIYYCTSMLKKIKSIINGSYSYIVPSTPSIDFVSLCHFLNLPLYSSNPQSLLYLQTNSGFRDFLASMGPELITQYTLPHAKNIYSLPVLANELAFMIQSRPHAWRWIFKIDNEQSSRGLAYLEVNKIIPKRMLKFIRNLSPVNASNPYENIPSEIKSLSKEIFNLVYKSLTQGQKLKIISENVYKNQNQFLNFFYSNGGIIEADVNCFQQETANLCFCVEIQPDNEWRFLSNYKKISIKKRSLCCYYDSQLIQPPIQIHSLIKQLIKRKQFGYFVFQFLKQSVKQGKNKTSKIYFNGMKCYLDSYSSAGFMREFISKDSNALYIPYIAHENIGKISMSTFFHLCRLQNISFDIERKIGNIFMFLDGLESGCLGMMTFNDSSKIETFIHAAEVLDFFSSNIDHTVTSRPSQQFLLIRNSINGYLNCLRKKKLAVKSGIPSSTLIRRGSTNVQSYKDKDYLQ